MVVQFLLALLIAGAFNKDLEENLDDQLTECTDILNHARNFYVGLPNFDNRRRLVGLEDDVEESLDACMAVVQAVNDFYNDNDGGADVGPFEDPIVLNVGGTQFSTTLAALRSENGTYFERMFRNESTAMCSADGTFFIDRNPKTFEYILDYLRTGDLLFRSANNNLRSQLLEDAEFFELGEELIQYLRFSSLAGIDLSLSEVTWLNNQLPSDMKLGGLLFDTSKDGDDKGTFHDRCDNEGATVTIVETRLGVIFGGYTDVSWSTNGWGADEDAFVFRLRPSPEKFIVSDASRAMYKHSSYGPYFGNKAFVIYNHCQDNTDSIVDGGSYYGIENYALNMGHQDYRVKNYAVVQVV